MAWLDRTLKKWENKQVARKKEDIQLEYNNLCAQLGELQFHVKMLEIRQAQGNQRIMELQKEMEELEKASEEKKEEVKDVNEAKAS